MKFNFDHKPDIELLANESTHDFEVFGCLETISKRNIPMLKLNLLIVSRGVSHIVYCYISSDCGWLLKSFFESVNYVPGNNQGECLAEDFIGMRGQCVVSINDKNKTYKPNNCVSKFLPYLPPHERRDHLDRLPEVPTASPEQFELLRKKIREVANLKSETSFTKQNKIDDDDVAF
jgi:hypothetical protein